MTTIMLNQKKSSSFLSSLLLFIGITSLIFILFFLGKRHYQQSKDESENYEFSEEVFEPLSDEDLPPPKEPIKEEPLAELSHQENLDRIEEQRKWKKKVFPRLYSDITKGEISDFLDFFFKEFLDKGLKPYEKKWIKENISSKTIRPKKVNDRTTTKETLNQDIERCKEIFPELKGAKIDWRKFDGWLSEKEKGEKEKDYTTLMGLCKHETKTSWIRKGSTSCHWTYRRIAIKLKPELFYFRRNSWVDRNKFYPGTAKPIQIKVGWKQIIKTIAHELAHAVINTILISEKVAKLDEGGHGNLHNDFTDRIQTMIKNSHELDNFKKTIAKLIPANF